MNSINSQTKYKNSTLISQTERSNTVMVKSTQLSTFDKSFDNAITFDSGKVIPIIIQQLEPGDTINIKTSAQIRLSNMLTNPLSTINYDVNYFFVAWEYIDKMNKEFFGERNEKRTDAYKVDAIKNPKLTSTGDKYIKYTENDVAGYLGLPINKNIKEIKNIKPFLAYGKIFNEWYRDENYQDSIDITSVFNDNRTLTYDEEKNKSFLTSIIQGKKLAPSNKLPDYFTSILPNRQMGEPVKINLGNISFNLPRLPIDNQTTDRRAIFQPKIYKNGAFETENENRILGTTESNGNAATYGGINGNSPRSAFMSISTKDINVNTDVDGGIDIASLREALTYQHLLERLSLTGSRYIEQLKSLYGIELDVKLLQRSELIGGFNENLIFSSVVQTSASTDNDLLGKLGTNLNNTVDEDNSIEYSASLHGYIIGLITCRTPINYGNQGFPEMFDEEDSLDVHNPLFNGISEQPVKRKRLYFESYDVDAFNKNDEIIGYNEPFQHLKQNYSKSAGYLSLNSEKSLFKYFLYGEKYTEDTVINNEFMEYNPEIIGNTLFKPHKDGNDKNEFYHQFIASFFFNIHYTTQQPLFNSPGVNYI